MYTTWFYPNTVTQFPEVTEHVGWNGEETGFSFLKAPNQNYVTTKKELLHIANSVVNDLKMKTYFLYLSNFKMTNLPNPIQGVEVEIEMKRGGRITDETIQLRYNNEFIGKNKADYKLDVQKTYSGSASDWGVEEFNSLLLTDTTFGVGIRYQSHPSWPHKESAMINYVRIRAW